MGKPELTSAEVARRAGVDLEQARRLWRALGFAPVADEARIFTRADVKMLQTVQKLIDDGLTTPAVVLQLTRATGQSLARLADVQITTSSERLDTTVLDADPALAAQNTVRALAEQVPRFEHFLTYVWRRHLLAALLRLLSERALLPTAAHDLVVGFADLVGFTAVSQRLDPSAIAEMLDHFEALIYAQIPERGGRVIKMIGDAAMFCVDTVADAAEIALALVEGDAGDATLPDIRVGLAVGPTVSFGGDLFGPTVNLASRLVDTARPSTILVSDEVGEKLKDNPAFVLRPTRRLSLKGIGRVRTWALRRAKVE